MVMFSLFLRIIEFWRHAVLRRFTEGAARKKVCQIWFEH